VNKRLLAGVLVAAVAVACVSVGAAEMADKGFAKSLYSWLYDIKTKVTSIKSTVDTNLDTTVSSRLSTDAFDTWKADWTSTRAGYLDYLPEVTAIEGQSGRLTTTETTTAETSVKKVTTDQPATFVVTMVVDVTDAGDYGRVKITTDRNNWVTLDEMDTDGALTHTVTAKGVEITYEDVTAANIVIDWGISVIARPGTTITWA